jgi:hypothetical protein
MGTAARRPAGASRTRYDVTAAPSPGGGAATLTSKLTLAEKHSVGGVSAMTAARPRSSVADEPVGTTSGLGCATAARTAGAGGGSAATRTASQGEGVDSPCALAASERAT